MSAVLAKALPVDDDYMDLIREFPLRPLRSKEEFRHAGHLLDKYVGRPNLAAGIRDYVDALSHFVIEYEQRIIRARFRKLSPIELLKHLMEANNMNTADLGQVLGTRGLASEVLNGKRGLSKALIAKLVRRFGIEAGFWLTVESR